MRLLEGARWGPSQSRESEILTFLPEVFGLHVARSYVDFMDAKKEGFSSTQLNTSLSIPHKAIMEEIPHSIECQLFTLTTSPQVTLKLCHL